MFLTTYAILNSNSYNFNLSKSYIKTGIFTTTFNKREASNIYSFYKPTKSTPDKKKNLSTRKQKLVSSTSSYSSSGPKNPNPPYILNYKIQHQNGRGQ